MDIGPIARQFLGNELSHGAVMRNIWGKFFDSATANTFVLLFMMSCLAACNTLSYEEPKPGSMPLARVRFITTSDGVTVLRVYDDPGCNYNETEWLRVKVGFLGRSQPKSLGMPLWDYDVNAAKEVYVAANKQINAMFFGGEIEGRSIYTCGVPFFYSFSEGHDYEVKYVWSETRCRVEISELVGSGQTWSRVNVADFDNRVTDKNRGCVTQFQKQRLT